MSLIRDVEKKHGVARLLTLIRHRRRHQHEEVSDSLIAVPCVVGNLQSDERISCVRPPKDTQVEPTDLREPRTCRTWREWSSRARIATQELLAIDDLQDAVPGRALAEIKSVPKTHHFMDTGTARQRPGGIRLHAVEAEVADSSSQTLARHAARASRRPFRPGRQGRCRIPITSCGCVAGRPVSSPYVRRSSRRPGSRGPTPPIVRGFGSHWPAGDRSHPHRRREGRRLSTPAPSARPLWQGYDAGRRGAADRSRRRSMCR